MIYRVGLWKPFLKKKMTKKLKKNLREIINFNCNYIMLMAPPFFVSFFENAKKKSLFGKTYTTFYDKTLVNVSLWICVGQRQWHSGLNNCLIIPRQRV